VEWEYKKWELLTGKHTIILVVATVPISATFYCAGESGQYSHRISGY
jgi:hypothetical protein